LNSSSFKYEILTREKIKSTIKEIFSSYTPLASNFICYVGLLGKIALDIDIQRAFCNFPKTYMESVNKGKYLAVIHLISKSGSLKAYYNLRNNNFEVKNGTKLLFISNSVGACTFEKLGFKVTYKTSGKKYPIKEIKKEHLEWEVITK